MNEFCDFSIQDEFDVFMEEHFSEDKQMKDEHAFQSNLEPKVPDYSSTNIFNMEEELLKSISNLSPTISPIRTTFEFPCNSNKIGGQIFRNVFDSKCAYKKLGNYNGISFPNFGRAEPKAEYNNCKYPSPMRTQFGLNYNQLNSERSYFASKADSNHNSFSKIPQININMKQEEKKDPNIGQTVTDTYKKLKIPRLVGFQIYPSFAQDDDKCSLNMFRQVKEESSQQPDEKMSKVNENVNTFEQHDTFTNDDIESEMIGLLTRKERESKVKRFLEKKKRRHYNKKVAYESRKKVADSRPRYKGRFVSFEQASDLVEEYQKELEKKLLKGRVFITEIFDRKTKELKKVIFPTEESMSKYTSSYKNVV